MNPIHLHFKTNHGFPVSIAHVFLYMRIKFETKLSVTLSHEFSGTDSRGSGDTFLRKEFSCWIRSREGSSTVFKNYVNCYIWHFRRRWKYCHPDNLIKLQTESREMKDEMNSVRPHSLPLDSICTLTLQSLHNSLTLGLRLIKIRLLHFTC